MTQRLLVVMLVVCGSALGARSASAEPIFLAKSETRCTSCHYSPTGGGLLMVPQVAEVLVATGTVMMVVRRLHGRHA